MAIEVIEKIDCDDTNTFSRTLFGVVIEVEVEVSENDLMFVASWGNMCESIPSPYQLPPSTTMVKLP
ncbi:hypothetical protein L1887_40088 [Cichorium endivia]|nr:hypothetical protein L1887_40088 [Cichorium endivia]